MPSITQLTDIQIPMVDESAYINRRLRVVTIGAGFSGLILAHKFQHEFPDLQDFVDHTIFEMADEVGGTWKVNTYPGVQCDVPAHIYAFPFDPNPSWSKFYSDGDEILDYVKKICDKWNLRRDIKFNTKVVANEWQEDEGNWKVTVEHNGQQRDEYADILVSAQGFLRSVFLAKAHLIKLIWRLHQRQHLCFCRLALNGSLATFTDCADLVVAGDGPTSQASTISRGRRSIPRSGIMISTTLTSELVSLAMGLRGSRFSLRWPSSPEWTLPRSKGIRPGSPKASGRFLESVKASQMTRMRMASIWQR